jgi:putative ABC transport system ATP-binding protein
MTTAPHIPTNTSVLELAQIGRTYPGAPPVHALVDVNLTVHAGEFVAVVGRSGSGKSTLLNVIGTLDRPTSGQMRIDGATVSTWSDRARAGLRAQRLGFVFQQFHLLEGAGLVDNVATGLVYRGTRRRERRRRSIEALERVGLAHRLDHRPNQLSGGERQRVAIARAIVGEPAFVLADEPTGNLDSTSSDSIIDLLRQLHRQGSTIIVVTHDRELAASFPRCVTMSDGRLVDDTLGLTPTGRAVSP